MYIFPSLSYKKIELFLMSKESISTSLHKSQMIKQSIVGDYRTLMATRFLLLLVLQNFAREADGSISLWKVFNLLTGSVKSSYIDTFLGRSVNAHELVLNIGNSIHNQTENWFLN